MPSKAIRLDDTAYRRLLGAKGLIEARDAREYSASDLVVILLDHYYRSVPGLADALKILASLPDAQETAPPAHDQESTP